MSILETDRLTLCELSPDDAPFSLELLNESSFVQHIGDKGVRTLDDARDYILNGPIASYQRFGFGLYLTKLKDGGVSIGICGLLKRETLEDVEIGFAFLPEFRRQGYALEAATAVLEYGCSVFQISRIAAILTPDNQASRKLLAKLGFVLEDNFQKEPNSGILDLYLINK